MNDFLVTFIFEGRQKGWTESYTTSRGIALYDLLKPSVERLATARAQLLGKECSIKAYRISRQNFGPDGDLTEKQFAPFAQDIPGVGVVGLRKSTANLDTSLFIRMRNEDGSKHKNTYLRGIWDDIENNAGVYTPDLAWNFLLNRFVQLLIADSWGWWGVTGRVGPKDIKTAGQLAGGQIQFETKADLFTDNDINKRFRVRVSGVNKKSRYNGVHVVSVDTKSKFTTVDAIGVGPYLTGGKVQYSTYGTIPIFSAVARKITTRQTGAPLLESPGRQKAQPKA